MSWQRGNYFESAALICFEKVYLIFMSVCFKSFDVSHDFSKTTVLILNDVFVSTLKYTKACMIYTNLLLKIKRVNDEEQLLRIFRSLYFEIKSNNHDHN